MRKFGMLLVSAFLLFSVSGCFLLVAGAAGGGGTAMWLSGKLSQTVNASYDKTVEASQKALKSMGFEAEKISKEDAVAQIKSRYTDGKEIWIDVRRVTEKATKVEVRVGAVNPDKEAADKILKQIQRYL
jgi:hypothetical protein